MIHDYSYWHQKPRTVKTKTTREYEYDVQGHVIKEVITVEETSYENGYWGEPIVTNKTTIDIPPPYRAIY